MGRKRNVGPKPKKRKRVTVQLLKQQHQGKETKPYVLLKKLIAGPHNHLEEANIAIAWRLGWRPDADNHLTLGKLRKRGDLDRELDDFDFVILLNKEAWETLTDAQQQAVIDHELCHAGLSYDADGEPKLDDRNRLVCRLKKHDVEEFRAVTERHGLWTADLSGLAQAAINDQKRPLLDAAENKESSKVTASKAKSKGKDGWKTISLADANFPAPLVKKLNEAGFKTLGQLSGHMRECGDWWAKELKGIGKAAREQIENLYVVFWKKHPEFCG